MEIESGYIAIDIGRHVNDDTGGVAQNQAASAENTSHAVVVVVPCFNEERRLDTALFIAFAARFPRLRFLFVDDGSMDGTLAKLQSMCHENSDVFSVLALPRNQGKAEAVRQGLLHALQFEPAYVAFWDADLATPLEELRALLCVAESHLEARMVVGSRVRLLGRSIERSMVRHYVGRVFATAASLILRLPLYDTQCGAKLLRVTPELPALLSRPFLSRWLFDVELFARMIEQASQDHADIQTRIIEYPLQTWREQGKTKLHLLDISRIPWDLLRIGFAMRRQRFSARCRDHVAEPVTKNL
ncbi:glycosyltransferase [Candidatus Peregrinibacteria bacterium]|nr:glycosyltransferase [Candidatus Peregrinibacteria bacterium]